MHREDHMANSKGVYRKNHWKAYDELPPTARLALQNAAFDWQTTKIASAFRNARKGFRTGPEIAAYVAKLDKNKHIAEVKRGRVAP